MKEKIEKDICKAIERMFINQPNFWNFTLETHQSEWNISHHLAFEINKIYKKYDCDLDIIKPNYDNKRPDIILHKRGSKDNFLVIEVKRKISDMDEDISKIKEFWFREPLSYRFGSTVVINKNKYIVKVFENK